MDKNGSANNVLNSAKGRKTSMDVQNCLLNHTNVIIYTYRDYENVKLYGGLNFVFVIQIVLQTQKYAHLPYRTNLYHEIYYILEREYLK